MVINNMSFEIYNSCVINKDLDCVIQTDEFWDLVTWKKM